MELTGLHHVSALTAQAGANVNFYTQILGLRLVKKTVNQDNTSSYHLFYGDEVGNAGTELTFFDVPYAARTTPGVGSITTTTLRVSGTQALDYWEQRLSNAEVEHTPVQEFAGRAVLTLRDFEGQRLMLMDDSSAQVSGGVPWTRSPVPVQHGIRGLGAVTLTVRDAAPTVQVMTEILGFREADRVPAPEGPAREIQIMATGAGGPGAEVYLDERSDLPPERLGRGGVHHVAFRVPTFEEHQAWQEHLQRTGIQTSGIIDRFYFRSIYFREPNGILFELATDGPGFATDEDVEHLGESLALPPFLEPRRAQIEAQLHPLPTA